MNRLPGNPRSRARPRLLGRAVFVGSLLVFLIIGIAMVGDFSAQWWLLLLPVALLIGPVLSLRREAERRPGGARQGATEGDAMG